MNTRRPSVTTTAAWSSLLAAALLLGALAFLGRPVEAAPVHYVDDTGSDAAND